MNGFDGLVASIAASNHAQNTCFPLPVEAVPTA
jgi:hypothetical protein